MGCNNYGVAEGQLGESEPETYWAAMAQVYGQCLLAIKPGGVLCVVVKAYVKAGKIVPLPDMTAELLARVGFEPVCRIRAMLTAREGQGLIGGGEHRKERKSFFRRLAERKGSPRIDYEEIIVVRRPKSQGCADADDCGDVNGQRELFAKEGGT